MSECVTVERLLEGDPGARAHAGQCPACASLADDLIQIRGEVASLEGWAGQPLEVDTEAALSAVWAGIDRLPRVQRTRRGRWLLQAASSLAAALVLFTFAAPPILRLRIDSSEPGARMAGPVEGQQAGIFWTTAGR